MEKRFKPGVGKQTHDIFLYQIIASENPQSLHKFYYVKTILYS